jgi:hypothetical protein
MIPFIGGFGDGGGYRISRSQRFRQSVSTYLSRTLGAGNRQKFTIKGEFKLRGFFATQNHALISGWQDDNNTAIIQWNSPGNLIVANINAGVSRYHQVAAINSDPGAWLQAVIAVDTTQAVEGNRVKVWFDGVAQTLTMPSGAIPQNENFWMNNAIAHAIGRQNYSAPTGYFDGCMADLYFIDGLALDASAFGYTDPIAGVWMPRAYAGAYGANGFHLDFADNSAATAAALGKDTSGNGNNWTPNNISVTAGVTNDSLVDVPTSYGIDTGAGGEVRGNYATWNPLFSIGATVLSTFSDGNLKATGVGSGSGASSTIPIPLSSQWFAEVTPAAMSGLFYVIVRAAELSSIYAQYASDGAFTSAGGGTAPASAATFTVNDVIGVAVDQAAQTIKFYKNGALQGTFTSVPLRVDWVVSTWLLSTSVSAVANFGQRPWAYAPPAGYKALCTQNLPTPAIIKPNKYFDVSLISGANPYSVSLAFQPDLVWVKDRVAATDHTVVDAARGLAGTPGLSTDLTAAEFATGAVNGFNASGYTGHRGVTNDHIGWSWKEGVLPGLDIITYTGNGTGQNVAHNLGVAPSMYITKSRSAVGPWYVYHKSSPSFNALYLNTTAAGVANTGQISSAADASQIHPGNNADTNANGVTFITYAFAEVHGFSKFGTYVGNGSADGMFIYCGFRPRLIMFKRVNITGSWLLIDTARDVKNPASQYVLADTTGVEGSTTLLDVVSNGFKFRQSGGGGGNDANTHIFAAFAETPFKYARAR